MNEQNQTLPDRQKKRSRITDQQLQGILRAAELMLSDLKIKRSITELTRTALINEYDFKRLFRVVFSQNRNVILQEFRLAEAKKLLTNTNMQIKQIAEQCGYKADYFTLFFKQKVGVSPQQFRKSNMQ